MGRERTSVSSKGGSGSGGGVGGARDVGATDKMKGDSLWDGQKCAGSNLGFAILEF